MTNSIEDIEEAKAFLIIGSNTTETHPVIGYRVRRAKRNGASVIVVDPRRIRLAEEADIHLQLRPGTNVALLKGLAKVILDENLYSEDFVLKHCEGFEEYSESLKEVSLKEIADITGVSEDKITKAARIYAENNPATILYAMGITQHAQGTDNVLALASLAMLTGNLGKRGGGVNPLRGQNNVQGACDMGALPNVFPGYQPVTSPEAQKKFEEAYGAKIPDSPGLAMTEMFDAAKTGKLKALYIMGENPLMSEAYTGKVKEAIAKLDFMVVQDIFFTETAAYADVVLPASSFAEKEGTFVNTERRVQRIRKAVNPPGEAQSDLEIISALASKLGLKGFSYPGSAEVMQEMASLMPKWKGISYERLENGGICWPCPDNGHPGTSILYTEKFLRDSGKALFKPVKYQQPRENVDQEYPYILTTGRILYHYHTGTMTRKVEGLSSFQDQEIVWINPDDADRLGIKEGDQVKVSSRRGEVLAGAAPSPEMAEGTIFMTFHFSEACANELTNTEMDPIAKIPELKVCAVKVEPA